MLINSGPQDIPSPAASELVLGARASSWSLTTRTTLLRIDANIKQLLFATYKRKSTARGNMDPHWQPRQPVETELIFYLKLRRE